MVLSPRGVIVPTIDTQKMMNAMIENTTPVNSWSIDKLEVPHISLFLEVLGQ